MSFELDLERKIAAALELMRQGSLHPETMEVTTFCAIHDKRQIMYFTKQPSGLFRLTDTEKVFDEQRNATRTFGRSVIPSSLRLELFERLSFPCAWCGNCELNYCRKNCGQLVCGGKSVGNTFHCRKSCGASWVGVPLDEVPAQTRPSARQPMVSPVSVRQAPPSAKSTPTASNALRLGTGTGLAKRNDR
jgi:hypothetical protein